ncbi:MAG TPA: hypothetical protein VGO11_00295 [Chthoniobacteraceae bacterium]|jgi:hypothetical protein|nr:hypothetical protein [Chthoniobacteraceae bacterium]
MNATISARCLALLGVALVFFPLAALLAAPSSGDAARKSGVALDSPPPGFDAKRWRSFSPAVRDQLKHPDYRHHILAVDEEGSALLPVATPTKFDNAANPVAWRVTFDKFPTEDTKNTIEIIPAGPRKGKLGLRREFIEYLEGVPGHLDGFGHDPERIGLFENYRRLCAAGAVDHVIIYVHGGLNFIGSAAVKACELTHAMLADRAYPIFVCWNSNLFGTYAEHLVGVREGIRMPGFALATAPLEFAADAGTAVSRAPLSTVKLFRNDIYHLFPHTFTRYRQAEDRAENLLRAEAELPDSKVPVFISGGRARDDERSMGKKAEDAASWTFWLGSKVATTPVIHSLGTSAWYNMVRRTRVMFERESSFVHEPSSNKLGLDEQRELRWASRCGALRLFFERAQGELAALGKVPPITLIGHSVGAIVAGETLNRFEGIPFANVVFLAAASTVNDFKIKVVPYLQHHPDCRFYDLCLHPENETGEREPFEHGELAPRGSLLVWIDSLFDNPIAEDDRTMGRWENAILATDWLPNNANGRITVKAFGRDRRFPPLSETGVLPVPYERDPQGDRLQEPDHHGVFTRYGEGKRPSYRFWRPYFWTAEPIRGVKATDTLLSSQREKALAAPDKPGRRAKR